MTVVLMKTTKKDRRGTIPVRTIHKFMDRTSAWFSRARSVLDALAIVGPESEHPDVEVVARLKSEDQGGEDLKTFLERRVALRKA